MSESVPAKTPASGHELQTFLSRLVKVILRPQAFWSDLGTTMPPVKEVVFPHMVVLVGMQALAAFVGTLIGKGLGAAIGILITTFITSCQPAAGIAATTCGQTCCDGTRRCGCARCNRRQCSDRPCADASRGRQHP